MEKRVVITGMGAITPVGNAIPTIWQNLISGKSGISRVSEMPPDLKKALGIDEKEVPDINPEVKIFGFVKGFNPEDYGLDRKNARRMDRFAQFGVAAAKLAVNDAGLEERIRDDPSFRDEIGAIISPGLGGQITDEAGIKTLLEKGCDRVSPFTIPMIMPNASPGNTAIFYGGRGPNFTVGSACATGTDSIIVAYKAVRDGDAIVMAAGGAEAVISRLPVAGFVNLKALTTSYKDNPTAASRPFDKARSGFVLSEGAAVLILEDLEHALNRNAHIYGEIAGYGQSSDAYHITQPHPGGEGTALAIRKALKKAGMKPEDISYINAHGTSTQLNDTAETLAIKKVFGEYAYKVPISAIKSMTGHMIGAAGAFETLVCALVLEKGIIPPTINLDNPDIEGGCDLNYVPNVAVKADVNAVLKGSSGFGGHNSALVLRKYAPANHKSAAA